jgi:hypothetical protein
MAMLRTVSKRETGEKASEKDVEVCSFLYLSAHA